MGYHNQNSCSVWRDELKDELRESVVQGLLQRERGLV